MIKFPLHATPSLLPAWEIIKFETIDSTNNYPKDHLDKIKGPTLIIADHQVFGRGRRTNVWNDDGSGNQLLSSWVKPLGKINGDPRWTIALGYLLYKSLKDTWPQAEFSIKAPNDIFIKDKKVAGLLIETTNNIHQVFLIVGLGLNVFSCPTANGHTGTFLAQELGKSLTPETWKNFMKSFAFHVETFDIFISSRRWLKTISPELIKALNANPLQKANPIINISEDGSLALHQGYLNWLEL